METNRKTRSHETVMEMPAPVERVWKAITDASDVQGWLAPEVKIDAREGGEYWVSWGGGMNAASKIEVFDAPHHLRVTKDRPDPGGSAEPVHIAIDYYVETKDGGTVLRLVHSGFLASAEWDKEYDGTKLGWPMMLRVLSYTLAHHPNERVRQNWFYSAAPGAQEDAWQQVRPVATAGNEVVYEVPPREILVRTADGGDGLLYVALGEHSGKTGISVNVVRYGEAANHLDEAVEHWKQKLNVFQTATV